MAHQAASTSPNEKETSASSSEKSAAELEDRDAEINEAIMTGDWDVEELGLVPDGD